MSYFAMNAQEESLKIIAQQMEITNIRELLRELHANDAISDKEYTAKLMELLNGNYRR